MIQLKIPCLLTCFVLCFNFKNVLLQDSRFGYNKHLRKHLPKTGPNFAFAKHFQSHMVLQQAPQRANVYGFSNNIGKTVNMQVVIIPSMKNYNYSTTIESGPTAGIGVWNFLLDPFPGNTTVTVQVYSEGQTLSLIDVIFGDVWICSGQSNMQFTVIQIDNAEEELADAHNYPNIRLMTVNMVESSIPLYDLIQLEQNWTQPSRSAIGGPPDTYFSAVCWLFGKAIHKARGYPVGLIASDYTSTPAEAWSSPEALAACGNEKKNYFRYKDGLPANISHKVSNPANNSVMWNSMIHPLLGLTIYGVIWYQGESDAIEPRMSKYNCTFPTMIKDWRMNFNKASNGQTSLHFPFGFVQLAPYRPDPSVTTGYSDIRWHQTADRGNVPNPDLPNVFMAVAMDLADFTSPYGSGHPRKKKDVAERLALSGLAVAYGQSELYQGPLPVLAYLTPEGLIVYYGNSWILEIRNWDGFEVLCGSRWAPTGIIANNETSVTLFSEVCGQGEKILGLRYAWKESPCAFKSCAVYESINDLPAPPFVSFSKMDGERTYFTFKGPTFI